MRQRRMAIDLDHRPLELEKSAAGNSRRQPSTGLNSASMLMGAIALVRVAEVNGWVVNFCGHLCSNHMLDHVQKKRSK